MSASFCSCSFFALLEGAAASEGLTMWAGLCVLTAGEEIEFEGFGVRSG